MISSRRKWSRLSPLAVALVLLVGCGRAVPSTPLASDVSPVAVGAARYSIDVQPITSSDRCTGCHIRGTAPHIALGTYAGDSTAKPAMLQSMITCYGELTPLQLAKVQAWLDSGRPSDGAVSHATPTPSPSAASPASGSVAPTPAPLSWASDIQPFTSSQNCSGCHQSGNAPRLGLGQYSVDSVVNATKLRAMLATYGGMDASQLSRVDAWVQAGRPMAATVAPTPSPGGPTPAPVATPRPVFSSPHIIAWKYLHGMTVKLEGGYQSAHISNGGSCTNCHTAVKLPNGTVPPSPGSDLTCFSCHNGPKGGD